MLNNVEASILATLAYSDIFDYPLTFNQIHQNLIFEKTSKEQLTSVVTNLLKKGQVLKFGEFYQLEKPQNLARKRTLREKYSLQKIQKTKLAVKLLSFIPTVKLIGISGSLALQNTPKKDDIDFFVICAENTLFTTRFFCNLVLDFLKLRRKPKDLKFVDKICLNMFVTENDLDLAPHDLYLAHEILQMKPIFVRDNTYQKFLVANFWVFKFLPNWPASAYFASRPTSTQTKGALAGKPIFNFLEFFLKKIQLKYMSRRRTTEIISDTKLFFHPKDIHQKVLEEFEGRLRRLRIPLDKSLTFF